MNFEQLELKPTDSDQYLASMDGQYFYIGPLLYEIVVRAKSLRSPVEIVEDLKQDLSINLDIKQVEEALEGLKKRFNPEGIEGGTRKRTRSSYIHFKWRLMGGEMLEKITRPLSLLFRPKTIAILGVLSILITGYYYLMATRPEISLSSKELAAAYLILFCVFFIHELGHAAATKYYGMKPHEISFGFYLVFPVFFADVSEAWSLNKYKRIIINLGGVYFQLIINAIFVSLAFIYPSSSILATLLYTNLFVIAYSLMPFLRYDGYWIYSDLFEIPNLMSRSILYPYQLWAHYRAGKKTKTNWPLLTYSVSSYLFFMVMFYFMGRFVAKCIEQVMITTESTDLGWMDFLSQVELSFFFRAFIVLFMISFLTYRLAKYGWAKFIKNF
ncbi:M50 family metallopeptidase [Neolewinella agarilytica]|uniref:Putative peptide zinc metalloprotease protein n=1 Tax=Neolewinella agarilytica TaxID=478744 RepID=A0A1H9ALS2_9BACT|nr:M50 family metallopeptidase [Neolewinella agarilytica]SEP76878.1 putative peptide zinc metalloprotease protein [Neolewinella agarilytica]